MAVDTRDKRMSLIGLGAPLPRVLPHPDGAIGVADRAMLLYLYYGLSLAVPVPVVVTIPTERIYNVAFQDRTFEIALQDRTFEVSRE